jgi:hypothetical protein
VTRRSGWRYAGIVLAVVIGVLGLALVGAFVLVVVGMAQWGSNK